MNVLFIIESSLSNPILFSQGIPHIQKNSKRGVKYFVLSFEDKSYFIENPMAQKRYDDAISELKDYAQIFPIRINGNKLIRLLKLSTIKLIILGFINGIKIVKHNKIDIVHGRSNFPTLIALCIKTVSGVKVIYDNRGLISNEFSGKKKIRVTVELIVEKVLLKYSDRVVVVSKAFKNYLVKNNPQYNFEKLKIIQNSYSEKRFVYSEQLRLNQRKQYNLENKLVMVYSGPSVFWQRFDLVLNTFKALKEMRNEAFLLVVSYDPEIENKILDADISVSDFLVKNVPASEVNNFLIAGDFGVIFRDNRIRSKVCAPIKLGEYLASGLPIFCMDQIGDTDEIIGNSGVGIIIKGEHEIKGKLKDIINLINTTDVKLMCRKVAEEKLSLTNTAEKYYNIYKEINSIG